MRANVAILAALAIAMATAPVNAQTVYSGMKLNGVLQSDLSSKDAQVGTPVVLTNVTAADGSGKVVGATLYGHVVAVQRAGQGARPEIQVDFTRLRMPNGATYACHASIVSANVQTKSNATREIVGAVVGNIVGNYLGKHVGTNLGGAVGLAGGFLYAKNYHENVTMPHGSVVTVEVTSARRQSG
jgi:hypothetical protein